MILTVNTDIELRSLDLSDASDIFGTINSQREYLGKWLPFVEFTHRVEDSESYVRSVTEAPDYCFEHVFAIRKQNVFAGLIGFKDTDRLNKKTEIGYWLSVKFQKQGIITQSVSMLCQFAFNELGLNRVQIKCAVGNNPSRNVPLRLGFTFKGIERQGELLTGNIFADLEIYSKLKSESEA
jgi:ribosomal-protein-serine acetyltransferase